MAMPLPTPDSWTTNLLAALPDDGQRYELVHGTLLVSPSPSARHQWIVLALACDLRNWLQGQALGEVYVAPATLPVDQTTEVQPDVFVSPRPGPPTGPWQDLGRPLLVVEVASPSTVRQDREQKRRLYQRLGIPEYWIVDPDSRTVEVWTPTDRVPRVERELLRWHPAGAPGPWEIEVARLLQG